MFILFSGRRILLDGRLDRYKSTRCKNIEHRLPKAQVTRIRKDFIITEEYRIMNVEVWRPTSSFAKATEDKSPG